MGPTETLGCLRNHMGALCPEAVHQFHFDIVTPDIFIEHLLCDRHCYRFLGSVNKTKTAALLELTFQQLHDMEGHPSRGLFPDSQGEVE